MCPSIGFTLEALDFDPASVGSPGCHLTACSLRDGDVIFWNFDGGIIIDWLSHPEDGLYVRYQKLDCAAWFYITFFLDPHCCQTVHSRTCHIKVERKSWGTTWKVTKEVLAIRVSITTSPTIPAWYRYTEDMKYIMCLE